MHRRRASPGSVAAGRRRRRRPGWAVVWLAAVLAGSTSFTVEAAPQEPGGVDAAVRELVAQARRAWATGEQWPGPPDRFAERWAGLAPDDVLDALTRSQHAHPAVDAYVRCALLELAPPLSAVDAARLRRLVANLPAVIGHRQVAGQATGGGGSGRAWIFVGRQIAFVSDLDPIVAEGVVAFDPEISVVSDGVLLDVEGTVTIDRHVILNVRATAAQLQRLREFLFQVNRPAFQFRRSLAERLPAGAAQLDLLLQDLGDRMEVAAPSYEAAAARFVEAARRLRTSEELSRRHRLALMRRLNELAKVEKRVLREIHIRSDEVYEVERETIAIDEDQVTAALAYLQGIEP